MNTKSFFGIMAAVGLTGLMALAPLSAQAKMVLRVGHTGSPGMEHTYGCEQFKKALEEAVGDKVEVKLFGNAVLGSDRVLTESVQQGTLEVAICGASILGTFIKTASALDLPFLVDPDKLQPFLAAWNYKDGKLYKYIDDHGQKVGLKLIAAFDSAYRSYAFSKNKKVSDLKSLQNLKMRTTPSVVDVATCEALGMIPCPLGFGDVYTALQQGTVDGEIINAASMADGSRAEVEGSLLLTNHNHTMLFLFMNAAMFNGLPADMQTAILEAGQKANELQYAYVQESLQRGIDYCTQNNVKLIELTDEQRAEFEKAVQPVYEKFKADFDPEFMSLIADTQK